MAAQMIMEAKRTGRTTSWFTNDQHAMRYISKYLPLPQGGPAEMIVRLPSYLGKCALGSGRIVNATKVKLLRGGGGKVNLDHAYPLP